MHRTIQISPTKSAMLSISKPSVGILMPRQYGGGTLRLLASTACSLLSKGHRLVISFIKTEPQDLINDSLYTARIMQALKVESEFYSQAVDLSLLKIVPYVYKSVYLDRSLPFFSSTSSLRRIKSFISCVGFREFGVYPSCRELEGCDIWLQMSAGPCDAPLLPVRPIAVYVTDLLQRYYSPVRPSFVYNDFSYEFNLIMQLRTADLTLCTTPATLSDIKLYAGRENEAILLPLSISRSCVPNISHNRRPKRRYFVWVTNTASHKNHRLTIEALEKYLLQESPLHVKILGPNTHYFNPDETRFVDDPMWNDTYIACIRQCFANLPNKYKDMIHFVGHVEDVDYWTILQEALFVVHSVIADNGTFVITEAASLGTPVLSSRYPHQEYTAARYGLLEGKHIFYFSSQSSTELYELLRCQAHRDVALEPLVLSDEHFYHSNSYGHLLSYALTKMAVSPLSDIVDF